MTFELNSSSYCGAIGTIDTYIIRACSIPEGYRKALCTDYASTVSPVVHGCSTVTWWTCQKYPVNLNLANKPSTIPVS